MRPVRAGEPSSAHAQHKDSDQLLKDCGTSRSGDGGRHQHCDRLPSSSEVPSGALDVRQRSDRGLHQERGRHMIVHTHADDDTPAEVV